MVVDCINQRSYGFGIVGCTKQGNSNPCLLVVSNREVIVELGLVASNREFIVGRCLFASDREVTVMQWLVASEKLCLGTGWLYQAKKYEKFPDM